MTLDMITEAAMRIAIANGETILSTGEPTPEPVQRYDSLSRNDAIERIKAGLKKRSGKAWSVTGGRGTSWGWIKITAPPKRRTNDWEGGPPNPDVSWRDYLTLEDATELGKLLGMPGKVHPQGESIPAGLAYYWEYVDRAEGNPPREFGEPYWD